MSSRGELVTSMFWGLEILRGRLLIIDFWYSASRRLWPGHWKIIERHYFLARAYKDFVVCVTGVRVTTNRRIKNFRSLICSWSHKPFQKCRLIIIRSNVVTSLLWDLRSQLKRDRMGNGGKFTFAVKFKLVYFNWTKLLFKNSHFRCTFVEWDSTQCDRII